MATDQLMVKMIFDRWNALLKSCDTLIEELSDEQLLKEITPGKNRGIYLLGHLIAVHDDMLRLLGLGDKQYPKLYDIFVTSPDKTVTDLPSAAALRELWKKQNEYLSAKFNSVSTDEWFNRHTAVPAEEFANEPHRNKLNIIITRSTHLAYHTGQLVLLK